MCEMINNNNESVAPHKKYEKLEENRSDIKKKKPLTTLLHRNRDTETVGVFIIRLYQITRKFLELKQRLQLLRKWEPVTKKG